MAGLNEANGSGGSVAALQEIARRLRAPDGCPWDREQTHASLKPGLIEECYEVLDAIDSADDANLSEELGDLLLQVVMHSEMATERGAFEFDAVVTGICEKLVRRHPHVFGDASATDTGAVLRQWEEIKRSEKGERKSVLDGVPRGLPALQRAEKVQKKAARVGFDWELPDGVLEKIDSEIAEVREAMASHSTDHVREEAGDLLFTVVSLVRKLGLDCESTLNEATGKFARRFQAVENEVRESGRTMAACSLDELDAAWESVKRAEG